MEAKSNAKTEKSHISRNETKLLRLMNYKYASLHNFSAKIITALSLAGSITDFTSITLNFFGTKIETRKSRNIARNQATINFMLANDNRKLFFYSTGKLKFKK